MYKEEKEKTVKKVLFTKYDSSSSGKNDPKYVSNDNDDSADEEYLYCNETFKNDILGGKWIPLSVVDRHMKCVLV